MYGEQFDLEQPDGSMVPVLVWGDEFYQRIETPDGRTLIRNNETGWICYAELSTDSTELIPTEQKYQPVAGLRKATGTPPKEVRKVRLPRNARLAKHREVRKQLLGENDAAEEPKTAPAPPVSESEAAARSTSSLENNRPVNGNLTGLTILIDFNDQEGDFPIDTLENFVNGLDYTGFGNNGSVREFYLDVSGGRVDYENVVVGYYRARNPKTYYDSRTSNFGSRAQELIMEALRWLQNEGFDFSQLSTTTTSTWGGGTRKTVQAINVLYAGSPTQGWSQGLWPHQGRMNNVALGGDLYASVYQMSNLGRSLAIGTFCHENGHMLFSWPDLYDYGGESGGVSVYCLMCNTGSTNPIPPCCYLRDFCGWDAVTDITDMLDGTVLTQNPDNQNRSFVYRNPSNDRERFYIEARRKSGRYGDLPEEGFLIWHVDQEGDNDDEYMTESRHYLVSLEQADGNFDFENGRSSWGSQGGDLFKGGYKDRFDDNTSPDAKWWSGSNSDMKIYNMSDAGDTMSFSIGEPGSNLHTVTASADEHGMLNPVGAISVPDGGDLMFFATPDSGYQIDAITIDDAAAAISDTFRLTNITEDHLIRVVFGLKGALRVVTPEAGAVLYANDTTIISWRSQGVTLQGINASFSIDGGATFTPIQSGIPATDSQLVWPVPLIESDSCIIKLADTDDNPTTRSGKFSIRKKPVFDIAATPLTLSIDSGATLEQPLTVTNSGIGDLAITAATRGQLDKILINELWLGEDPPAPDAIELFNNGPDMDISGWQIVWDDNFSSSGTFTFPEGFIFKEGGTYTIVDRENDSTENSQYMGLNAQWQFDQALELAVTLLDAAGRGVDFIKSSGIPILPPEGTSWTGGGITLCASVQRNGSVNHNSADDWTCRDDESLMERNTTQQGTITMPLLSTHTAKATVPGSTSSNLTLSLDASTVTAGVYTDTLIINHNDPSRPSPLLVPCVITVVAPLKVTREQKRFEKPGTTASPLVAAPNPVRAGEQLQFNYHPKGDEQKAELSIYSRVGDCLATQQVDVSHTNALTKKPVRFSWPARNKNGAPLPTGTLVARLVVTRDGGSRDVFTVKIGIR